MMYPRLVLIIGAVILLSATPTLCQVSFSQGDTSTEPLSVDSTISYSIPITNEKSSTLDYSVALKVGTDKDNQSISLEQTRSDIFVDPHQTKNVVFNVNFYDPQIDQGEFKQWLKDKNDARTWDKAWYRAEISEFREQIEPIEGNGHPLLMKTIFEYSDAGVSPKQGTGDMLYSYKVTVLGSYKDNITLQISPYQNAPWIDMGTRMYANPGVSQTLEWSNTTLKFDFGEAHYRFAAKKPSTTFDGPFWPVTVQIKNNTLSPVRGTPEREFQYSLGVNASKSVDVQLNVLDVGTGKYVSEGAMRYNNSSTWENLTWHGIKVTSMEDVVGQSSYYFSFHYPGSTASFNSTKDMLGVAYPGPNISSTEIDADVNPFNGTIYTTFTYTARINTAKPTADIELQIQPPNSSVWQSQGMETYSTSNSVLKWTNLSFRGSPEVLGIGRYRFMMDNSVLGEFSGPKVDVAVRNESFKKLPNNNFDYTAEVRSVLPKVEMELMFTDDGVTWIRSGLFRTYTAGNNSSAEMPWEVLTWQNQPWHKTIRADERRIK